jgi:predicted small lipoprotein YifL
VISRPGKVVARMAVVGALIAAFGVSGCGRKAGLDPPPVAAVSDPSLAPAPDGTPPERYQALGPGGKPVAPKTGEKRWFPLDFLVD